MVGGLQFVWVERFLLGTITLDLFAVLLAGATAMFPVFARDILHAGPDGAGLMRAAVAFGSVAVAVGLALRPIARNEIGRASCRERGCQYVEISGVAVT